MFVDLDCSWAVPLAVEKFNAHMHVIWSVWYYENYGIVVQCIFPMHLQETLGVEANHIHLI